MENIILKAYDDLGKLIGASSCTDDQDLQRAKEACLQLAQGRVHVNFEVIRNPKEEDVKDITDRLEAQGEYVEAVKADQAYVEICEQYDNGNITVTEAINRINAIYLSEEDRANRIAELLNNQDARLNGCECEDCDCTEDDLSEDDEDSYQA